MTKSSRLVNSDDLYQRAWILTHFTALEGRLARRGLAPWRGAPQADRTMYPKGAARRPLRAAFGGAKRPAGCVAALARYPGNPWGIARRTAPTRACRFAAMKRMSIRAAWDNRMPGRFSLWLRVLKKCFELVKALDHLTAPPFAARMHKGWQPGKCIEN
jgi:hypothetical protein